MPYKLLNPLRHLIRDTLRTSKRRRPSELRVLCRYHNLLLHSFCLHKPNTGHAVHRAEELLLEGVLLEGLVILLEGLLVLASLKEPPQVCLSSLTYNVAVETEHHHQVEEVNG